MDRADHAYAACYCEENVWQLAGDPHIAAAPADRFVVFISNRDRRCPLWAQRSAPEPELPAIWDYHVILIGRVNGAALVYDLDSTLAFPTGLAEYLASTFPFHDHLDRRLLPRFRVIGAEAFRATFASDRSHMREHGQWKALPPPWPCIATEAASMNLDNFIDTERPYVGEVVDLVELERKFSIRR